MAGGKVFFHVDMNCFFASCEIADNPSLKGKKIAIGHMTLDKKGIIVTASYEAKRMGVKTTMKIYEVERICPDIIIVEPHYERYQDYSRKFFSYLYSITDQVVPGSIDEGYMDVTGVVKNNEYVNLAKKIQDDLLSLYNLPCSIGIGPNLFLAKMGSDLKKPLGISVIRKKDVPKILWPLPIEDMFGCGKKTCALLKPLGINTIGDIANYPDMEFLSYLVGPNNASYLVSRAHGEGSTELDLDRMDNTQSISNSRTFDHDEYNIKEVEALIKRLTNSICDRMNEQGVKGKTFTLSIKYANFKTRSKATSLSSPTSDSSYVYQLFIEIFDDIYDPDVAVRHVGVCASKLVNATQEYRQLSIFDDLEKEELNHEVTKLVKKINEEFGEGTLVVGVKEKEKQIK